MKFNRVKESGFGKSLRSFPKQPHISIYVSILFMDEASAAAVVRWGGSGVWEPALVPGEAEDSILSV